jgi:hypothetical protein
MKVVRNIYKNYIFNLSFAIKIAYVNLYISACHDNRLCYKLFIQSDPIYMYHFNNYLHTCSFCIFYTGSQKSTK